MIDPVLKQRLLDVIDECDTHLKRLRFAYEKIAGLVPLNLERYQALHDTDIAFVDQFVFRFSKLQDAMGRELFPVLLRALGEDIWDLPFLDRLNRLEQLGYLESAETWQELRKLRNAATHEYRKAPEEAILSLNMLLESSDQLQSLYAIICKKTRDFLRRV